MAIPLAFEPLMVKAGMSVTGWSIPVAAVGSAGGAMIPDMDHRHATVAQSLGPVSKAAAVVVGLAFGGHRNGTHSILGFVVFTAFTWALVQVGGWPLMVWLGFVAAVGSAALQVRFTKRSIVVHTLACLGLTWLLFQSVVVRDVPMDMVVWGFAVGYLAHIAGDMLTKEGCPLAWPVSKFRVRFASITTGHFTEEVVIGPGLGVVAVVLTVLLLARHQPVVAGFLEQLAAFLA